MCNRHKKGIEDGIRRHACYLDLTYIAQFIFLEAINKWKDAGKEGEK